VFEIFDRWIARQKIAILKGEIAHMKEGATRHALEEELLAEQKTLKNDKPVRTPNETAK
jgi:hypothetical protein